MRGIGRIHDLKLAHSIAQARLFQLWLSRLLAANNQALCPDRTLIHDRARKTLGSSPSAKIIALALIARAR